MQQAGVPVVPGYQGEHQDTETLLAEAEGVGYPLLVKAAAGGGGRGMRVVQEPGALAEALEGARREAQSAFADGTLLLERYVSPARHVEVQVFGDTHGSIVHLGERECSIQRRHQKVVEESPSAAVVPELRAQMGDAAVRAARAVGYVGAGTVEFVLDAEGRYFFLEMNTRIQVEHPVTELATGLDLVKLQLQVAAGEPLPFGQQDVRWSGHAIECRLVAEDPRRGFAPQAGVLTAFEPPCGVGIRNDVGTYAGDRVDVHYDALLAKLIVHGRDRAEAIARMRWALGHYQVAGVQTNLELLRFVLAHPEFAAGRTFTDFLAEHWRPSQHESPPPPLEAVLVAAGADLLAAGIASGAGPAAESAVEFWRVAGPWRVGRGGIPLSFTSEPHRFELRAERLEEVDRWRIAVRTDGAETPSQSEEVVEVGLERLGQDRVLLRLGNRSMAASVSRQPHSVVVQIDGSTYTLGRAAPPSVDAAQAGGSSGAEHGRITSPMPAKVVDVRVQQGDRVKPRQPLVVLESMKIEHLLEAPYAATVERVHCRPGDVVTEGAPLVELDAE
jgi:3-methylcrotonyl-CoA carboxylase alpha subunit